MLLDLPVSRRAPSCQTEVHTEGTLQIKKQFNGDSDYYNCISELLMIMSGKR